MTIKLDYRSFILAVVIAIAGTLLAWPAWQTTLGTVAIVAFGLVAATMLAPRLEFAPPTVPSVLPPYPPRPGAVHPLTRQQTKVASLVAQGLSTKEMAAALFVEESTIENHIQAIFIKLDFHRRPQIAVWAVEHGLHKPEVTARK